MKQSVSDATARLELWVVKINCLVSQVRIAIAEVGLDPTIGYLHVCQPGRQALIYDLMEPYRPVVDCEVLAFLRSQTFMPRDFIVDNKGVCRLNPQLARNV